MKSEIDSPPAPPSPTCDIFISYTRKDAEWARALVTALEKRGWSIWWDTRLRSGEHFDDVIQEQLDTARRVLVLWSQRSVKSDYVKAEAKYALKLDKLVPVAIDKVELPFLFQTLETRDLSGWDGSEAAPEFQRLADELATVLGARAKPEVPVPPMLPPSSPDREARGFKRYFSAGAAIGLAPFLGNIDVPLLRSLSTLLPFQIKDVLVILSAFLIGFIIVAARFYLTEKISRNTTKIVLVVVGAFILWAGMRILFVETVPIDKGRSVAVLVSPVRWPDCKCAKDDEQCIENLSLKESAINSCFKFQGPLKLSFSLLYLVFTGGLAALVGLSLARRAAAGR